jgi:hypothetical protein
MPTNPNGLVVVLAAGARPWSATTSELPARRRDPRRNPRGCEAWRATFANASRLMRYSAVPTGPRYPPPTPRLGLTSIPARRYSSTSPTRSAELGRADRFRLLIRNDATEPDLIEFPRPTVLLDQRAPVCPGTSQHVPGASDMRSTAARVWPARSQRPCDALAPSATACCARPPWPPSCPMSVRRRRLRPSTEHHRYRCPRRPCDLLLGIALDTTNGATAAAAVIISVFVNCSGATPRTVSSTPEEQRTSRFPLPHRRCEQHGDQNGDHRPGEPVDRGGQHEARAAATTNDSLRSADRLSARLRR